MYCPTCWHTVQTHDKHKHDRFPAVWCLSAVTSLELDHTNRSEIGIIDGRMFDTSKYWTGALDPCVCGAE